MRALSLVRRLNGVPDLSFPDRLVDCSALKRNLESFYSNLLPKGGSPFVYLSLQIHPANVDVNVSPTKSEVHFLHQEDMIEIICDELQKTLAGANQSRTFTVQVRRAQIAARNSGQADVTMPVVTPAGRFDGPDVNASCSCRIASKCIRQRHKQAGLCPHRDVQDTGTAPGPHGRRCTDTRCHVRATEPEPGSSRCISHGAKAESERYHRA